MLTRVKINPKYFFLFCLLLFAGSLMDTHPRVDDDFLGEQVYWLIKDGHVRSELMSQYGDLKLEQFQAVYHKLFIWTGGFFTNVLGWGLLQLHLVSLTFLLLFFWLLWRYLKARSDLYPDSTFWWIAGMMLIYHESKLVAFTFRPEIMLMTIGFVSWIFLEKYLTKQGGTAQTKNLLLSGLFAGLAMLTHLNGLIFIFAGCGVLLLNKKIKEFFLFGVVAGVTFLLYFVDILYFSSLEFFFFQFTHDPSIPQKSFSIFSPLVKLLDEHFRLFLHTGDSLLSIAILLVISSNYKYLRSRVPALLFYTLFLILGMAAFANIKTAKYMVIYLPFVMLVLVLGISHIFENSAQRWLKNLTAVLILAFTAVSIADLGNEIFISFKRHSIIKYNQKIGDLIPDKNAKIIAHGNFIFNEIKRFPHIVSITQFTFYPHFHENKKLTFDDLITEARRRQVKYIVFDEPNYRHFNLSNALSTPGIKFIFKENDNAIVEILKK